MTDNEEVAPVAARPMTAEERRQRRLAKILGNPEERINRILNNGSDENGKRHAPAIEGGEGYNILPSELEKLSFVPITPQNLKSSKHIYSICDKVSLSKFININFNKKGRFLKL